MAANLRRASNAIRKSFRSSKYAVFGAKDYASYVSPKWTSRSETESDSIIEESGDEFDQEQQENVPSTITSDSKSKTIGLRRSRSSAVTQSMREAVVNIRQKLRMSTRRQVRLQEQSTPTRVAKRRSTFGGVKKVNQNVKMSSPFCIDTPTRNRNKIKTCISLETPTRLRREVEDLTANMQALSALTPNTLQTRTVTRRSPPLTNGSLRTPRSGHRRIITEV